MSTSPLTCECGEAPAKRLLNVFGGSGGGGGGGIFDGGLLSDSGPPGPSSRAEAAADLLGVRLDRLGSDEGCETRTPNSPGKPCKIPMS